MAVVLETSIGDLTIDLFTDERPRCCLNFLKLCKVKYYNFCLFHSVQKNLVAQTGDPTGNGKGGESVFSRLYGDQARFFDMETNPRLKHKAKGTVSMVNNGSGMHGSQFFITLGEDLDYLDGQQHTVFGQVAEGKEILDKLNEAYCDEEHRPYVDVRIYHTVILDDPYDDPPDLQIPDRSPEPTKEMLDSGRIRADEEINDMKDLPDEKVKEILQQKEANANAQLLEMVGDLPEADVKPPDNVLFVCKLNPVTTDEDLEMIFSRFGEIKSCEVIKDQKTGESLQYAFIEFENEPDCENAYFKMDNVLIDDRRIHVDFSQSVSKMKLDKRGCAPAYTIKDTSRKNDKYDLVFDHNDEPSSSSKKKKKEKKKKSKKHRSSSSESTHSDQKKRSRERSRSPDRRRSRSPPKKKKEKRRSREREEGRRDRRSRSVSPRRRREDKYDSRRDDRQGSRRDRDRDRRR